MTMTHLIKRRPLPALRLPLNRARAIALEPAPEPAWRQDVRDFLLAYFTGLVAFGTMLV